MKLIRNVYIAAGIAYGPIEELVPDVHLQIPAPAAGNGSPPKFSALIFNWGNESHVFVLDEDGRQSLIRLLTGGIVIAPGGSIPPPL